MNWKHFLKIVGFAALGGAAVHAGQAAAEALSTAGSLGAVIAGMLTTLLAAYATPPNKA